MNSVYKEWRKALEPHVATAQRATAEIEHYLKREADLVVELTDGELDSLLRLVELATQNSWSMRDVLSSEKYKREKEAKAKAEGEVPA